MAGQLSRLRSEQRYRAKNKERITLKDSLNHYKTMVKIKERALKEFDERESEKQVVKDE